MVRQCESARKSRVPPGTKAPHLHNPDAVIASMFHLSRQCEHGNYTHASTFKTSKARLHCCSVLGLEPSSWYASLEL
jgi:hypothetical protein